MRVYPRQEAAHTCMQTRSIKLCSIYVVTRSLADEQPWRAPFVSVCPIERQEIRSTFPAISTHLSPTKDSRKRKHQLHPPIESVSCPRALFLPAPSFSARQLTRFLPYTVCSLAGGGGLVLFYFERKSDVAGLLLEEIN